LIDVDIISMFNRDINLGIAGDWLHGSRIEGAYLSGLELAESILERK
jgi:predicted NAD/FAD-dependent oxidoreductase